ncbi:Tudor domain containing protein [Tritrichomonas foetus]|uniref:Tudor domain containing protein n=1 Tax=Tritrichomonas foetus TaxID=1144522 RepID=A0A1J4JEF5_9EUKA|nr:Tudor domain containing protein [Tritrichomonas foetus]|eukprot:OHS96671.1 Tudor domain containing protein [Tritrichomonas foetus]
MSHQNNTDYRGIVEGILSGDSLIIRFLPPCPTPIQIVSLEHLVAPKFGLPDGNIQDEPHGFHAWDFLRRTCIGRRVTVSSRSRDSVMQRVHPAFGKLPIIFNRVKLIDNDRGEQDVGTLAVKEGWVKVRNSNQNENPYIKNLQKYQSEAEKAGKGIWAPNGFVRHLPVDFTDDKILSTREFDAIVEGVSNGTTLSLFLLPNHELIMMQIAGCRAPQFKRKMDQNSPGFLSHQQTIRKFLHRVVRVRVCQKVETNNYNQNHNQNQENKTFVGCLVGAPDRAIVSLIKDGLAQFYHKTADFAPNADQYISSELEAREAKRGIWANNQTPLESKPLADFEGKVISIRSSSSLLIQNGNETKLFHLNNIRVPYFFYNKGGGSEPHGFEAREFLRRHYVGQLVKVVHDGSYQARDYATIYNNRKCINEELVRNGLAEYSAPIIGRPSERETQIKQAETEAKAKKLGLFGDSHPEPVKIIDLSNYSNKTEAFSHFEAVKGKKFDAIIEHVSSGSKFLVFIPSLGYFIRSGINGILPYAANDEFGSASKNYCMEHFQQADIEITPSEIDKYCCFFSSITVKTFYGKIFDLAEDLIGNGLAEIHSRLVKTGKAPENFVALQRNAAMKGVGVWADRTRHNRELVFGKFEKVKIVTIWNTVMYAVQFLDDYMNQINEVLNQPLTRIEPEEIKTLHRNQCVVAKYKNKFYRARIENFEKDNSAIKEVKLIDIQQMNDACTEFYHLPEELKKIEPQARAVKLAFMDPIEDYTEEQTKTAVNDLWSICSDVILYMHLVYDDDHPNVLLTDQESPNSGSLNSVLLNKKYAKFTDHEVTSEFENVKNSLKEYIIQEESEEVSTS